MDGIMGEIDVHQGGKWVGGGEGLTHSTNMAFTLSGPQEFL